MYKLVCIDMDGTLLNDDKIISERNIKALKNTMQKGVIVAVSTGRLFTSANYFADIIGANVPVIASNGAYIMEKNNNKIIYESSLGEKNCIEILSVLKKYNLYPHFNTCRSVFTEKIIYSSYLYLNMNKVLSKDNQIDIILVENWEEVFYKYGNDFLKCIVVDDDTKKISEARKEVEKIKNIEVVSSSHRNFEIMNKGVSKGNAVLKLANYYNISKDEIMCIGDSENDMSMIKCAGFGVVMENGEEKVKQIADYITDTNNKDGVAKALEKFVL